MKRFMVFGFDNAYPLGGLNDLLGFVEEEHEIDKLCVKKVSSGHFQVLDLYDDMKCTLTRSKSGKYIRDEWQPFDDFD